MRVVEHGPNDRLKYVIKTRWSWLIFTLIEVDRPSRCIDSNCERVTTVGSINAGKIREEIGSVVIM